MGSRKKELGASGIDSRGAYMQHAGLVFCAPRDSFPSGNQELFSDGVYHTLEGNRRADVCIMILLRRISCSRDAF